MKRNTKTNKGIFPENKGQINKTIEKPKKKTYKSKFGRRPNNQEIDNVKIVINDAHFYIQLNKNLLDDERKNQNNPEIIEIMPKVIKAKAIKTLINENIIIIGNVLYSKENLIGNHDNSNYLGEENNKVIKERPDDSNLKKRNNNKKPKKNNNIIRIQISDYEDEKENFGKKKKMQIEKRSEKKVNIECNKNAKKKAKEIKKNIFIFKKKDSIDEHSSKKMHKYDKINLSEKKISK